MPYFIFHHYRGRTFIGAVGMEGDTEDEARADAATYVSEELEDGDELRLVETTESDDRFYQAREDEDARQRAAYDTPRN